MSNNLKDHFQNGCVALDDTSGEVSGSYFGLLIVADDTAFTTLDLDVSVDDSDGVLSGGTFAAGLYLPVGINTIELSGGAVLIGKTGKR